jgi:uncharacterized protein YcgI (DUF1989 family)
MEMSVSQDLIHIPAQHGSALRLRAGDTLCIVAVESQQVSDLALFDASDIRDSFSPGRTIDYNESLDVTVGSVLYSHRSARLAEVVEDTVSVHDMLLTPCSSAMFERRGEPKHRSCHENLYTSLAQFGIGPDDVVATLNVFMDVRVGVDRKISIYPPPSKPGDRFAIRALRDLVVGITACSSEVTNAGSCKPVSYEVRHQV